MPARKSSAKPASSGRIFAVVGSEEAQVKQRAKVLAAELTPAGSGEFGLEVVDGSADNADQAVSRLAETIQAMQTMPFFGSEKLVWLKDINFLADTVTGRAASTLAALDEFRAFLENGGIPAEVKLLLSAGEVDKRRSFYKAVGKLAQMEVFDKVDTSKAGWEEDAQALALQFARERQLQFRPEALELFIRRAGADSRQIQNELNKIDLFLGPARREVDLAVVRDLVSRSMTGVVWELSNSILKRDLAGSLQLLDILLFQGETAIGILLAAIIPTVRNLVAVKELLEHNQLRPPAAPFQFGSAVARLPPAATEHLPRKKDGGLNAYALGLAACEAHRFTLNETISALEACLQANLQLVTTQLDPKLVLSQLLVRMLARAERAG
ncbi:MAG: DNA polymerase III subunit delta [Verrucomicrobia bacterium]|nr:DNA polymerase III subunit delta [Verrucomicrobiota bacterium]